MFSGKGIWFLLYSCSLFGVHTLQELQKVYHCCVENKENKIRTVLILGPIPTGISLPCSFIKDVIIHDTDIYPSIDLRYLQDTFQIGRFSPVRLIYLVLAASFEAEYFMESSRMLRQYQGFLSKSSSDFYQYLLYSFLVLCNLQKVSYLPQQFCVCEF